MGHPLVDEFVRARDFRPEFLRRCQRVFREEVQPALDATQALTTENASLRAQVEALMAKSSKKTVAA